MTSNGGTHGSTHGHIEEIEDYKHQTFPPGTAAEGALVCCREQYDQLYRASIDPASMDEFWGKIAEGFYWKKDWQNPVCR